MSREEFAFKPLMQPFIGPDAPSHGPPALPLLTPSFVCLASKQSNNSGVKIYRLGAKWSKMLGETEGRYQWSPKGPGSEGSKNSTQLLRYVSTQPYKCA